MSRAVRLVFAAALVSACGDDGDDGSGATSDGTTGTSTGDTTTTGPTTGDLPTGTTTTGETSTTAGETSTSDSTTGAAEPTIEEALSGIDGLEWEERPTGVLGYRSFLLYYRQPADHGDPDGQQFTQHMTLLHRDAHAPTVIGTDGYRLYKDYQTLSEPAVLLHANYLQVEHRFFAESRPDPADWAMLTIEQAAADHHRITEALQTAIYDGPWVATGASKGGMTATYFRRFYPDDVVATVAYVAPLSFGIEDPRYWPYLEGIVPPCTTALTAFRREVLLRRPAMLERVAAEAEEHGLEYTLLTMEQALEVAALEASWGFWQYGGEGKCASVPTPDASDDQVWNFLRNVNPVSDNNTARLLSYEPYYWQAAVQLGAPGTDESALADLLLHPGTDVVTSFIAPGKQPVFDPTAMEDISTWMASEATAMLFIYGERDPWTAGAYEADPTHDVYRLTAPNANHGAGIGGLAEDDRALAYERLEAWTGVAPLERPLPLEARRRAPL